MTLFAAGPVVVPVYTGGGGGSAPEGAAAWLLLTGVLLLIAVLAIGMIGMSRSTTRQENRWMAAAGVSLIVSLLLFTAAVVVDVRIKDDRRGQLPVCGVEVRLGEARCRLEPGSATTTSEVPR